MNQDVDRQSFVATVAAKYGRQLRRFLASRLRNPYDATDLAQEVYLRLLRFERHQLIRNPEAYLITIASHLLHEQNLRRSGAPSEVSVESVLTELRTQTEDDPAEQADVQQRIGDLERVIEQLSPKAQAALLLHRRDGYSIKEIGAHLGVSRPMAKKYLARALVHCRQRLERHREHE